MNDYFASSMPVTVLSWIVAIPAFVLIFRQILFLFRKRNGINRPLSIWIGVSFLFLSPIRYLFFLLLVFAVFPFQSVRAFHSIFGMGLLAPLALVVLYAAGFFLPLIGTYWIAHVDSKFIPRNTTAAAFLAPAIAILGSVVFSLLTPAAALATRNLDADGLIRATNGPAYLAFHCVPSWLVSEPKYLELTPASVQDTVRAHVADVYLDKTAEGHYMKEAYPWLMDDEGIAATLGIAFEYKSDGTPSLTPASLDSLSRLIARGNLSEQQQRAYGIVSARGLLGGGDDAGGGPAPSIDAIRARLPKANCH